MQDDSVAGIARPLWRRAVVAVVAVAYLLMLAGVAQATRFGSVISAVALVALGTAVAWLTLSRASSRPKRLGARVEALWRRERTLAATGMTVLYLALITGAVIRDAGEWWQCAPLPRCASLANQFGATQLHHGLAAVATVLVGVVALWSLHTHAERSLRRAARAALSLMVVQSIVGLLVVSVARSGLTLSLSGARLAHLGIGAITWSSVVVLATLVMRVPPSKFATAADGAAATPAVRQPSRLKDYVSLTKPGVISLLIFTTLAGMLITPAGVPRLALIGWTMLGGWLMPAGAHALNCYFDRDIDGKMGRTGRRPIPSGRIPAWHALALGLALGAVSFAILAVFVNLLTSIVALIGYIYYAVIYTVLLKRHSVHNIVIGGGAGSIPPLVGWAAATGSLTWASLLLFAVIFYWTPPHFWALALIRRTDYANAGVPMLPVVVGDDETKRQILIYTLIMVGLSLLLTPAGLMGWSYLVLALALGLAFVACVLRMMRDDTTANRWALYRFSLLYLFLLFVAMIVDRLVFG